MAEKIYIYQIYFPTSDKFYVGQTNNLERRMLQHLEADSLVSHALEKYLDWEISVLRICSSRDEANIVEQEEIKKCNCIKPNGYNVTEGGLAHAIHPDTKKKLSIAHTGKEFTDEHKRNIGIASSLRTHTEETKYKMRQWHNDPENKADHAEKVSKALKGKPKSDKEAERLRGLREGVLHTEESKIKMRETTLNMPNPMDDPVNRKKVSDALTGRKFSEEHCQKLKESAKKRPPRKQTQETKDKIRVANTGHDVSQETRDKISATKTGVKMSDEFCKNRSEYMKGDNNPMNNPVSRLKATYVKKLRLFRKLLNELPDRVLFHAIHKPELLLELHEYAEKLV